MNEDGVAVIARADETLYAWTYLDNDARTIATEGPLAGEAFGVKDIIDVRGMPTRFGVLEEAPPARGDAWCVAALRAAGAVPIGKTATTAFAWRDPAPTRHPTVPEATPGGSSSGSAAAVAAGHVAFALGTQTVGSTLRPAAYCGIVGYKPTYGTIPVFGVSPLAPSLDHVGILARDVETATRCARVFGVSPVPADTQPRIGFAADAFAQYVGAEVTAAIARLAREAAAAGGHVERIALPASFFDVFDLLEPLIAYEAFALHEPWTRATSPALPPHLAALLRRGAAELASSRAETLAYRRETRAEIDAALQPFDAVMLIVADTAPNRTTTGFGPPAASATFYGLPAVSLPIGAGARGLPIGVQLVARLGDDARLLATARWLEAIVAKRTMQQG